MSGFGLDDIEIYFISEFSPRESFSYRANEAPGVSSAVLLSRTWRDGIRLRAVKDFTERSLLSFHTMSLKNFSYQGWRTKLRFLMVGVFLASADLVGANVPAFKVREIREVSPEDGFYHGWPTVLRLRDGSLLAAYSGGRDAHVCPFGRVEVMVSLNQGRTWSWPTVAMDSPIDDRDAGLLETKHGTLLLTTFRTIGFTRDGRRARYARDQERWDRYMQGPDPKSWAEEQGPMILRSEDGGRSWSQPASIPVSSPHGPIQLSDGRLLFPGVEGVGKGEYYKPGERRVGVWESRDDGRTWSLLSEIPTRPGDNSVDYHELHGIEAANGTLIVQIRSHDGSKDRGDVADRHMLQTISTDGGRSWSIPRSLGLNGYPPHLLRLRDDRLLMSFDQRHAPFGVGVRLSSDHGETWSQTMLLTKNETKLDQGYPSTVQLDDGSFLTLWYETSAGLSRAILRQAVWVLE